MQSENSDGCAISEFTYLCPHCYDAVESIVSADVPKLNLKKVVQATQNPKESSPWFGAWFSPRKAEVAQSPRAAAVKTAATPESFQLIKSPRPLHQDGTPWTANEMTLLEEMERAEAMREQNHSYA